MFTHAIEREFPLDIKSQFDKTFCLYLCVQFSGFVWVLENLESLGIFSSPGKRLQFLECPKNLNLTQAIKFSEFMLVMYLDH